MPKTARRPKVSLRSGTCRSCRPKPQCQARRSPRRFCPACAARRSARGLKRRKSGLRSEWSRRASCRARTAKAARARRCCGRSRTPQALLRGCTVRRARRLPPCIAARRRRFPQWCAGRSQSAQAARKASAFRCFLRPAPLCFAGGPFPALRRGHFSLPLRRTSAVRQLLRPRLRQKARFPRRGTLHQALRSPARACECAFVFRSSPR